MDLLEVTSKAPRAVGLAAVIAVSAIALAAAPVLADTELGHNGQVGVHSLTDSQSAPGAKCRYKRVDPSPGGYSYEAKLRYVGVRPPNVRAVSGTQSVGWRFIVQRAHVKSDYTLSSWSATYRSPVQKAITTASQNAPFTRMSTSVSVPTSEAEEKPYYVYRVKVKMFWYDSGGTKVGTATHRVDFYRNALTDWPFPGSANYTDELPCDSWQAIEYM